MFGSYVAQFCETFKMIFSFAQVNQSIVSCQNNVSFQFPDFENELFSNNSFAFNGNNSIFSYSYSDFSGSVPLVSSQEFSTTESLYIRAQIDYNFVYGDVRFLLKKLQSQSASTEQNLYAQHYTSELLLSELLEPGRYQIQILTGMVQSQKNLTLLSQFPNCVQFKLDIQFAPVTQATPQKSIEIAEADCWNHLSLPSSFEGPSFLGFVDSLHISDDFYLPRGAIQQESINFQVRVASFLRLYTDPNAVDVDIYLYENNTLVARAIQFNKEEHISYSLTPEKFYELRFRFYRFNVVPNNLCETFKLELAIEPIENLSNECSGNSLPPSTLFPDFSNSLPFSLQNNYHFTQTNTSFFYMTEFTVPQDQVVVMRILSRFNFVWGHLSLHLLNAQDNSVIYTGISQQYSSNNLGPVRLGAGNYYLQISQLGTAENEIDRCVPFSLEILVDSIDNINQQSLTQCTAAKFSDTFNSVSFLSNISGQMFVFQETLSADLNNLKDPISFTLAERSLLRVFVPSNPTIDIDLMLIRGNSPNGPVIVSSLGFFDETIYEDLDSGDYYLVFRYLPTSGHSFPACAQFPVEISIAPASYLSNIPLINLSCNTINPPSSLLENTQIDSFFQNGQSQNFMHSVPFFVPQGKKNF